MQIVMYLDEPKFGVLDGVNLLGERFYSKEEAESWIASKAPKFQIELGEDDRVRLYQLLILAREKCLENEDVLRKANVRAQYRSEYDEIANEWARKSTLCDKLLRQVQA